MRYGPLLAGLLSAALFGAATPLCKVMLGGLTQFQLAGLLYLGAGLVMIPFAAFRRGGRPAGRPDGKNLLRLGAAVLFGGCMGPVFLLFGLASARASSVSLWLNLELAATAVLGCLVFRDQLGPSGWAGAAGALIAGVLVTAGEGGAGVLPAAFVALACLCWGLDNNLTALIDAFTPRQITMAKGLIAGSVNLCIGVAAAGATPAVTEVLAAMAVGAVCYGASIALFIASAQRMGAARAQIVFSSGPFFGMLLSFPLLSESPSWIQSAAAALLAGSILLMLRSRHSHPHLHARLVHVHSHRHDDMHHTHVHEGEPAALEHSHQHAHEALEHEHSHVPDLHHRHGHGKRSEEREGGARRT
jgi:drug/metabolite transporter (DMT)-like permease